MTCMQTNLVGVPFSVSEILLLLSFDQISFSGTMVVKKLNLLELAEKLQIDVTCMHTNSILELLLPSKMAKFPFLTTDYI